jgi:hypothetical protein
MDLQERLSHLENVRDWQGLVEELEKSTSSGTNEEKARVHLRLGRLLEGKFLAGVKALKHFQDAYKLNSASGESLARARSVYWDLGKLNMVQKLLEMELKTTKEGPHAVELLLELGDVLSDGGDYDNNNAYGGNDDAGNSDGGSGGGQRTRGGDVGVEVRVGQRLVRRVQLPQQPALHGRLVVAPPVDALACQLAVRHGEEARRHQPAACVEGGGGGRGEGVSARVRAG